jgi:hypothetical protein
MRGDVHRYTELLAGGLSREAVRRQVGGGNLHRLSRGVYGPSADLIDTLPAVFRRLPDAAVVGFHTGASLHGFGAVPTDKIHVVVPAGSVVPHIKGVVAHEAVLPVREPVESAGVPCAPPARCAIDLARTVRRLDALPLLDMALRVGSCHSDELRTELLAHARLRGVCQARQLVRLADPRPECRQESQLRLVLIDGGLPAPEPQVWVQDDLGIPIYRLDLGYRRRRIGIEYDGSSHLDRNNLRRDRSRMNWLSANGWRMRYFTDVDLYRRPQYIVATVADLLRS